MKTVKRHIDESVILERIAASDQIAFNQLFTKYRNRLFSYLYTITKSKEVSEEIVIDVFLKIWTGRSIVTQIDNFEAFLFRIARNKGIDFLRKTQRNKHLQDELWQHIKQIKRAERCDEQLYLEETERTLKELIKQLSPRRRKVFALSREKGFTYEEIAKELNISRNTVRNHIASSLQFIRDNLNTDLTYSLLLIGAFSFFLLFSGFQ